jgi:PhnB protein
MQSSNTFFAPQLFIKSGVTDIEFYKNGLGAIELRRFNDDDGSVHVAEFSINGAIFQVHEEKPQSGELEPLKNKGITCLIGLFVEDVDSVVTNALNAGATLINPAQDYDYGYRQAQIQDPFGHVWMIEKKID